MTANPREEFGTALAATINKHFDEWKADLSEKGLPSLTIADALINYTAAMLIWNLPDSTLDIGKEQFLEYCAQAWDTGLALKKSGKFHQ